MAKRAGQSGGRKRAAADAAPERSERDRVIDATMALLAERRLSEIGLDEIAAGAGLSLEALRKAYDGKIAILADFARRVDEEVLAAGPADPASGARDRLFEVMMRRFDALRPYRPQIRRLAKAARTDVAFACALHAISRRSQSWTLAAAGVTKGGLLGKVALEGLVVVHGEAMRTFLDDDDPDMGRTMAALDRALRRGERTMLFLDRACGVIPAMKERARRARDRGRDAATDAA